jgi:hypothetical protein
MDHLRTCACALALLLLAGCAATAGQGQATGHLAGRLLMEGGPIGPGGQQPNQRPISGTVTSIATGRQRVTVRVGHTGTFTAKLPPGRYQVSGRSPSIVEASGGSDLELPCSPPLSVTVAAGRTATIAVTCIVP